MKILIDTNLWISAMLSERTRQRIFQIMANPEIEILADAKLLLELKTVVERPKFKHYFSPDFANKFFQTLRKRLDFIVPTSQIQICRDPKDDYLLAICRDGKVDFLLTGDSDLLSISPFENTRILTLTDFENQFLN